MIFCRIFGEKVYLCSMQLNAITRKSALLAIILLVAILVAAAIRYWHTPFEVELADSEFRGRTISLIFAMFLFLCVGIVEGKIWPRSGLSKGYCTLPRPLYGLLSCGVFVAPDTLAAAATSLCFAVSLHLLLRSLHNADEKDSVFFASILLGITPLLCPPCVVLCGVIPLSIFILALSARQIVLMIIGYLLPLAGASYIVWYKGGPIPEFWESLCSALSVPQVSSITNVPYVAIVLVAAVVVISLWGGIYVMIRPNKMFLLSRVRRALHLFVWVTLLSLAMFFIPSCNLPVCSVVAVPITILLSFVLSILPNNHSTIAYWALLLLFVLHLFLL